MTCGPDDEAGSNSAGGWVIDRDHISDYEDGFNNVGRSIGTVDPARRVRFRLLDDDGEVYYGGWLTEGDVANPYRMPITETADAAETLFDWGAADAGSCMLPGEERSGRVGRPDQLTTHDPARARAARRFAAC